jgi:hypothetical protein
MPLQETAKRKNAEVVGDAQTPRPAKQQKGDISKEMAKEHAQNKDAKR